MIVLIICLVVVYLLCFAMCGLTATAVFRDREARVVWMLAFVPIVNLLLAVVMIMIWRTLYKENKNAASTLKSKPKK